MNIPSHIPSTSNLSPDHPGGSHGSSRHRNQKISLIVDRNGLCCCALNSERRITRLSLVDSEDGIQCLFAPVTFRTSHVFHINCRELIADEHSRGISQMIIENKTVLLDLCSVEELETPDEDSGLSAPFIAIYYDRPEIIEYLHRRGLDFSKYCDPMGFGTPFFYIVNFSRFQILGLLDQLGYSLEVPCDLFGRRPLARAEKIGNTTMRDEIVRLIKRRHDALDLLSQDCLRYLQVIRYRRIRKALLRIQRIVRGYWGRVAFRRARKARKLEKKEDKLLERKTRNKKVL